MSFSVATTLRPLVVSRTVSVVRSPGRAVIGSPPREISGTGGSVGVRVAFGVSSGLGVAGGAITRMPSRPRLGSAPPSASRAVFSRWRRRSVPIGADSSTKRRQL